MTAILQQISNYIISLDWAYILTLILLVYVISNVKWIQKWTFKTKISYRYQVLVIGVLYATVLFFLRGYTISKVEILFQSYVFAMVFHKLLVDKFIKAILSPFK